MTDRRPAPRRIRWFRGLRGAAPAVVIAAIVAALGHESLASLNLKVPSPPDAVSRTHVLSTDDRAAPGPVGGVVPDGTPGRRDDHRRALDESDGAVPDGATVFDDEYPGVANLDADLLRALREAATDAAVDGIEFSVNSGWRSAAYQDRLLREAISNYGSVEAAARWVGTPDTSAHVSGDAVDIESLDAAVWLFDRGAEYGLCQIYANEPWHYELRPDARDRGCPAKYPDPTHDPRMRR